MSASRILAERWILRAVGLLIACGPIIPVFAQEWAQLASIQAGLFPVASKVRIAMEGDKLVLAISHATGGTVEVRQRHQGGLEQWGIIGSEQSMVPWFGHAIAFRQGMLAVGSPAAQAGGPFTGEVRLYALNNIPGEDVLDLQEVITHPDQVSNGRFGYALHWLGDTLAVSAVSLASSRSSGRVALFLPAPGGYSTTPPLTLSPQNDDVPFIRWFGAAIARSGDRLAIAAPFSGFEATIDQQNVGSIHLFRRDTLSPSGWVADTCWSDLSIDGSTACAFERMELGRWGMAFVDGGLMVDHSVRYSGPGGSALSPWTLPDTAAGACPPCGLRAVRLVQEAWDFAGASVPLGTGLPFYRGTSSWCAAHDTLIHGRQDPGTGEWATVVHLRNEGGDDAWGPSLVLPLNDPCDGLTGPMRLAGPFFVRVAIRTGETCSVPVGSMRLSVEVFQP